MIGTKTKSPADNFCIKEATLKICNFRQEGFQLKCDVHWSFECICDDTLFTTEPPNRKSEKDVLKWLTDFMDSVFTSDPDGTGACLTWKVRRKARGSCGWFSNDCEGEESGITPLTLSYPGSTAPGAIGPILAKCLSKVKDEKSGQGGIDVIDLQQCILKDFIEASGGDVDRATANIMNFAGAFLSFDGGPGLTGPLEAQFNAFKCSQGPTV